MRSAHANSSRGSDVCFAAKHANPAGRGSNSCDGRWVQPQALMSCSIALSAHPSRLQRGENPQVRVSFGFISWARRMSAKSRENDRPACRRKRPRPGVTKRIRLSVRTARAPADMDCRGRVRIVRQLKEHLDDMGIAKSMQARTQFGSIANASFASAID